jgi:membrane protease YdiL (CAAX protease family)
MGANARMIAIGNWLAVNKREVTYTAFGVLFVIRVMLGYFLPTYGDNIPPLFEKVYFTVPIITLSIFILANKNELDRFNIDRYVIYTFVLLGIMLFLSFWLSLLGIAAVISSIVVMAIFPSLKTEHNRKRNFIYTIFFILVGIIPEFLLKMLFADIYQNYKFFSGLSIGTIIAINSIALWNVMYEELLFRSILWRILNDWKFSNSKTVLIQAVLFWLVHFRFTAFGLATLVFGIWTGFLTLRSKSLTPSIATHFVHNITSKSLF